MELRDVTNVDVAHGHRSILPGIYEKVKVVVWPIFERALCGSVVVVFLVARSTSLGETMMVDISWATIQTLTLLLAPITNQFVCRDIFLEVKVLMILRILLALLLVPILDLGMFTVMMATVTIVLRAIELITLVLLVVPKTTRTRNGLVFRCSRRLSHALLPSEM